MSAEPSTAVVDGIQLIDARTPLSRKSKTISKFVTDCNYGVFQVGDEKLSPPRIDLLRDDLNAMLGATVAGKTLTVTRYWIHVNRGKLLRKLGNMRLNPRPPGLIISELQKMGVDCPKEKMKAGWYDASEVSNSQPPYIVEIRASMDDKFYAVRTVYSPVEYQKGVEPAPPSDVLVVMRKANALLAEEIRTSTKGTEPVGHEEASSP